MNSYGVKELIVRYKKLGSNEDLMIIIEKMMPIICKNASKFNLYEYEDIKQELILALIVAVNRISQYENEGQCVSFLIKAVRNRFLELCRLYNKKKKETMLENSIIENMFSKCDSYVDVNFYVDLARAKKCNTEIKNKIWNYVVLQQATDSEIASLLNVSRQYVNKCKKDLFNDLLKY